MPSLTRAALLSLAAHAALAVPVAQVVETQVVTNIVTVTGAPAAVSSAPVAPVVAPKQHHAHAHAHAHAAAPITQATQAATVQAASTHTHHRHGKRGLAYNDASLAAPFLNSNQVSWAYNWGSSSGGLTQALEYTPLLWGTSFTGSWNAAASAAIKSGSRHLLGFNEPDETSQANLSPSSAAGLWKQYMEPFHGQALLGSPAVSNGAPPMGLGWLQEFMDACTGCHVHAINLHWYASCSDVDYFKSYFTQAHQQFPDHPIWITEFGTTDGDDDDVNSFFQQVLPWLDSQDYIHRYAYFMDAEGKLISGGGLSASGQTYAS